MTLNFYASSYIWWNGSVLGSPNPSMCLHGKSKPPCPSIRYKAEQTTYSKEETNKE